jgi:hypothetical protein
MLPNAAKSPAGEGLVASGEEKEPHRSAYGARSTHQKGKGWLEATLSCVVVAGRGGDLLHHPVGAPAMLNLALHITDVVESVLPVLITLLYP